MKRTLRERVYFNINREGDCWITGATIEEAGKRYRTRVLVYTWEVGEVPEGMFIVASCRNRNCVAPSHLYLSPWSAASAKVGAKKKPPKQKEPRERKPRPKMSDAERLEKNRLWRLTNPEKARESSQRYYLANRERILAEKAGKRSYKTEVIDSPRAAEIKERRAAQNRQYKANKRNVPSEVILLSVVREKDGDVCWLCGLGETERDIWTIDHVVPISKGGPNLYSNVRLAHGRCNSRKRDRLVA